MEHRTFFSQYEASCITYGRYSALNVTMLRASDVIILLMLINNNGDSQMKLLSQGNKRGKHFRITIVGYNQRLGIVAGLPIITGNQVLF